MISLTYSVVCSHVACDGPRIFARTWNDVLLRCQWILWMWAFVIVLHSGFGHQWHYSRNENASAHRWRSKENGNCTCANWCRVRVTATLATWELRQQLFYSYVWFNFDKTSTPLLHPTANAAHRAGWKWKAGHTRHTTSDPCERLSLWILCCVALHFPYS